MTIDKERVIKKTLELTVGRNEEGLIPFFGVYVQKLPIDFWNGFARRLVNSVPGDLTEAAELLLVNAAQESCYHTAHGVILSEDWTKIVSTMVKTIEDMIHGAFIAFSVWGWGETEIIELIPKEKMIVRAYKYYESDVLLHGKTKRPCAYMMRGMCAAFMDLAYGDALYPDGLRTFECVQTKGIEIGDPYGEFIVTRP